MDAQSLNYNSGLMRYNQMVTTTNFSEIYGGRQLPFKSHISHPTIFNFKISDLNISNFKISNLNISSQVVVYSTLLIFYER